MKDDYMCRFKSLVRARELINHVKPNSQVQMVINNHLCIYFVDTTSTGYVLQIVQNVDKGHGHKTCLNINVNRVTGYFYGKHDFPTDVFVRCIGVWSESSEDYSITIWQKQSKNCPCPVSQTQTDISCNSSCTMEPERERNSFNFNFIQGKYC